MTTEMLRRSGWFPGRDVLDEILLPPHFTSFPAALGVLREFGYLTIGGEGPGVEVARTPVVIDPMKGRSFYNHCVEFEDLLQIKLYPLGEASHALVVIDEKDRVFLLFEDLFFVDYSFDNALDNLINGLRKPQVVDENGHW
jgi:hypothetical protein